MKSISRNIVVVLILFTSIQTSLFGQFDNMFYFPGKTFQPIDSLNYTFFTLPVEKDKISGIIIKPETTPVGTVIFYHGAGGNVSNYVFMVKPLVKAGYQIYMVDFRGYGNSIGNPTHQNIAADGQLFFDYVLKQKETKKLPVVVYGASIGSQIATKIVKDNQSKINGFVFDGGMSSLTDIAVYYSPEEQKAMIRNSLKFPYGAIDDITSIQSIPTLFIASPIDKTVPLDQTKAIFEKSISPKEFFEFEDDHLEITKNHSNELVEKVNKMIGL